MNKVTAIISSAVVIFALSGVAASAHAQVLSPQGVNAIKVKLTTSAYQTVSASGCQTGWLDASVSGRTVTIHATGQSIGSGFPCSSVVFQADPVVHFGPDLGGVADISLTNLVTSSVLGKCEQGGGGIGYSNPVGQFYVPDEGYLYGEVYGTVPTILPPFKKEQKCVLEVSFETNAPVGL